MMPDSQISKVAKTLMYLGELVMIILLFGLSFMPNLSPHAYNPQEMTALYGWMLTLMICSYFLTLWLRPITTYLRAIRPAVIVRNATLSVVLMSVFFVSLVTLTHNFNLFFSPMPLLKFFLLLWVALLCCRFMERALIGFVRERGYNVRSIVFVGGMDNLKELYDELHMPSYGYKVKGYFNNVPVENFPPEFAYLGPVKDVVPYLQQNRIQQLYCGLPSAQAAVIRPIIDACERYCVRFYSVPNVRTYLKRTMQLEVLGAVPVLSIREDPLSQIENRFMKRTFDIVVSALFMIPFWILVYPVVAIITKITQPGPVFFKQKRNGLNGEVFYCYKFRSMKVNADADKVQATEHDPRKTKFGNFLRKSSIDELPQFINVLKGDMSIVGPRPHMIKHTEEYSALIDKYMVRHWVKPGITGWAQVTGARGETKELRQMEDRIKKDIWYIENWSFLLDLRIMVMTVMNALGGDKQAY